MQLFTGRVWLLTIVLSYYSVVAYASGPAPLITPLPQTVTEQLMTDLVDKLTVYQSPTNYVSTLYQERLFSHYRASLPVMSLLRIGQQAEWTPVMTMLNTQVNTNATVPYQLSLLPILDDIELDDIPNLPQPTLVDWSTLSLAEKLELSTRNKKSNVTSHYSLARKINNISERSNGPGIRLMYHFNIIKRGA